MGRPSSLALAGSQSRGGAPDQRLQPKSEMQNYLVPKSCITHFISHHDGSADLNTISPVLCLDTCEPVCFNLGMMLDATKHHSLIPNLSELDGHPRSRGHGKARL